MRKNTQSLEGKTDTYLKPRFFKDQLRTVVDLVWENKSIEISRREICEKILNMILENANKDYVTYCGTMGFVILFSRDEPEFVECEILYSPSFEEDQCYFIGEGKNLYACNEVSMDTFLDSF